MKKILECIYSLTLAIVLFVGLPAAMEWIFPLPEQDRESYAQELEGPWHELAGLDHGDVRSNPPRLRVTELSEFSAPIPTRRHLAVLKERCKAEVRTPYHLECLWALREVAKGVEAVNSILDPVYGRGELTAIQLRYVEVDSEWVMNRLKTVEGWYLL